MQIISVSSTMREFGRKHEELKKKGEAKKERNFGASAIYKRHRRKMSQNTSPTPTSSSGRHEIAEFSNGRKKIIENPIYEEVL